MCKCSNTFASCCKCICVEIYLFVDLAYLAVKTLGESRVNVCKLFRDSFSSTKTRINHCIISRDYARSATRDDTSCTSLNEKYRSRNYVFKFVKFRFVKNIQKFTCSRKPRDSMKSGPIEFTDSRNYTRNFWKISRNTKAIEPSVR